VLNRVWFSARHKERELGDNCSIGYIKEYGTNFYALTEEWCKPSGFGVQDKYSFDHNTCDNSLRAMIGHRISRTFLGYQESGSIRGKFG
jgi:hypothetical protein